tara:strand:- start:233 stop:454 length:222 start_codon:yes stop_codon:yes gene_type:complete
MHNKIIYIVLTLFLINCDSNNANYDCDTLQPLSELTNFSLVDKNPNSPTYEESIGPDFFSNTVRLFYFSNNPD